MLSFRCEIGPGTGVLTQFLLNCGLPYYAVEIDREAIEFLKNEFPEKSFIVEGDFLKIDLEKFPKPIAIIGNFPYYISSQIFFRVLNFKNNVSEVVCMIQKEVAERIAAAGEGRHDGHGGRCGDGSSQCERRRC